MIQLRVKASELVNNFDRDCLTESPEATQVPTQQQSITVCLKVCVRDFNSFPWWDNHQFSPPILNNYKIPKCLNY